MTYIYCATYYFICIYLMCMHVLHYYKHNDVSKNRKTPPNHPLKNRVFHDIFTIHFGFSTYLWMSAICLRDTISELASGSNLSPVASVKKGSSYGWGKTNLTMENSHVHAYMYFIYIYIYAYLDPPMGGVKPLRGCLMAPFPIHLAPLGGCWYIYIYVYMF